MALSVYYFDDELTSKSVGDFISEIDTTRVRYVVRQEEDKTYVEPVKLKIYISTQGGQVDSAFVLADYLYTLAEDEFTYIEVIVTHHIHSSGLFFLKHLVDNSNDKIKIVFFEHVEAIIHKMEVTIQTREQAEDMEYILNKLNLRNKAVLDFFKKHLTKKDIQMFNSSKDVILTCDRLVKIFKGTIIKTF